MSAQADLLLNPSAADNGSPNGDVVRSLGLTSRTPAGCPGAAILHRGLSAPIAALLEQGGSFHEDRRSIEILKAADPDLPIIYISRGTTRRRETAIRRLCIHYFLTHPAWSEELRLVLEVLVRAASAAGFHERSVARQPDQDNRREETGTPRHSGGGDEDDLR